MRRRAPAALGDVLREAVAGVAPDTLLARVQTAWPAAAGEVVAAESAPASEREGRVTVECSSAAWAHELTLLAPDLVQALNTRLGDASVRALRFTVKAP